MSVRDLINCVLLAYAAVTCLIDKFYAYFSTSFDCSRSWAVSNLDPLLLTNMTAFSHLKNELLRLDREEHHLEFLTTCRDIGLIPKFLLSRSRFHSKNFPREKFEFESKCLKAMIRLKHAVIQSIVKKIYGTRNNGLYRSYADNAVSGVFDHSMRVIEEYRITQRKVLDDSLMKKIAHLSGGFKSFTSSTDKPTYLNLSKHNFTERESNFLNRGPKYISQCQPRPVDFIPQLEDVVRNVPEVKREEIRCRMFLAYSKHIKMKNNLVQDRAMLKSLKSIPDITFLSTDKSNRIAILDKPIFLQKMENTIRDLKCDLVTTDPLPSILYKCNKVVQNFKSNVWPEQIRKMARVNPLGVIPKIFAVLKDHKPSLPLRPIVMKRSAATYYIEKTLVIILKEFLPTSEHVLSSTSQFIQRIQQLALPPQFFMFTFDIVSLYPSVDMEQARDILSQILSRNPCITDSMKNTIISAVNLIINSNYFVFNQKIYQQKTGAPMGSPISGIMAEFILRPLEQSFLLNSTIQPFCWMRFVDDIFGIWSSSKEEFEVFFDNLNNQDHTIQFTKEVEESKQLVFLDVRLTNEGNSITRSVYRKPCNTLCTIPNQAFAPKNYKEAAYKSYIKRALVVCSQSSIHEEFDYIRRIAVNNGFTLHFINNLIKKVTQPTQHPPSNTVPKRVPIQYVKGLHEKISNIVRPFGIHLIAHTTMKLKDILKTNIDCIPDWSKPGVYEIPMVNSNNHISYYIGQTARKLQTRIKEHKNDVRNNKQTSAIFRALQQDPTIKILFDEARIIAPFTTVSRTLLRESLEIFIRANKACNNQDSFSVPRIWLSLLK